jgi:HEPN domain-containing protein
MQGYLDLLDSCRTTRYAVQYSGELSGEKDAAEAIKDAEDFVGLVESVLGK